MLGEWLRVMQQEFRGYDVRVRELFVNNGQPKLRKPENRSRDDRIQLAKDTYLNQTEWHAHNGELLLLSLNWYFII